MVAFSSLVVAAAALVAQAVAAPAPAPLSHEARDFYTQNVQDSYIIKLKPTISDTGRHLNWVKGIHEQSLSKRDLPGVVRKFDFGNFHAYSGRFDESTIAEIEKSPDVLYVEKNQLIKANFVKPQPSEVVELPTEEFTELDVSKRALTSQANAPWGLGSISHRSPGSTTYLYDSNAGVDTWGYVVDTGIRTTHTQFQGRASAGWTAFAGNYADEDGHGTHVAGTIGGVTVGVAKKANLIGVKVLDGNGYGSTEGVLAGIEWSVNDIISKGRKDKAVINLSLGGRYSQIQNDLIDASYRRGVVIVVAAGNSIVDAKDYSPASAPLAITVGAHDQNWKISTDWLGGGGSNYGKVLDIFAPGTDILSSSNKGDNLGVVYSGTSMASPHVAGLVLYINSVYGVKGPKAVTDYLIGAAGKGVVTGNIRDSPNVLANNNNPSQ